MVLIPPIKGTRKFSLIIGLAGVFGRKSGQTDDQMFCFFFPEMWSLMIDETPSLTLTAEANEN